MGDKEQSVHIANDLGLHLRAAGLLVQTAARFESEVWLEREGALANGKSIMSVLSLAASKGTKIVIRAQGADAELAVAALVKLIEGGFEG